MPFQSTKPVLAILAAISLTTSAGIAGDAITVDAKVAAYTQVQGVAGSINSIGSDTLNNLMTFWAEGFNTMYPAVKIGVEGKGSSTAPPALIQGTAQLGPMSRAMTKKEVDNFQAKFGYKPTQFKVALDGLAVFVHKDNPLTSLTLAQVDGIFSSTYKRGSKNLTLWSELGLTGWEGKAISVYGRNSASGTYGFFKEEAMKKGDFKDTVKEQPGTSSVVQGVASDTNAIGYGGIGYLTSGVKALHLGEKADKSVEPTYANCLDQSYPLARYLYVYINKPAGKPIDKTTQEFLRYVLSKEGQDIVIKDGYFPLPADVVTEGLDALSK